LSSISLPRPAERVALISFLLVFLCGALAGAVAMNYWLRPGIHGAPTAAAGMSMSVREWKSQLSLTEEQTRQLTSILGDFARYYDNLLADGNSRIVQILNPEQKRRYEKMMQEHRRPE